MSDSFRGVPTKPETFAVRPLTKGMIRNLPPALLPEGAAYALAEANVYSEGLERRDGFVFAFLKGEGEPAKVGFVFDDEVIQDFLSYWTPTGSKQLFCLTNRVLYQKSGNSWMPVHWVRPYTKTTLVTDTITDGTVGRDFAADNVVAGMCVQLYNTASLGYEYYEIETVATDSLVLTVAPTGLAYDTTFYVIKRFRAESPFIVDWTHSATRIYFTDGYATGIDYWDGSVLAKLNIKNSAGTDSLLGARTIDFIGDRLFFGYCTDVGPETIRNRIRWSTALNDARIEDDAYQDLADFYGEILKLKVLGQYNVCYLNDGVAYGRLSNITSLPYVFNKVETGGVGLVGPRAVTGYLNRHFYVGVDDIYSLMEDLVPQKLGAAVKRITLGATAVKSLITAFIDPHHQRVLFGFPLEQNFRLDTYYAFYHEPQAWARQGRAWATVGSFSTATSPLLGDYPTSTWDDFPGKTYFSFGADVSEISTYYADYAGFAYLTSDGIAYDETPVTGTNLSEWPDDPAGTTYFQDAWPTVDGWDDASLGFNSVSAAGGYLVGTVLATKTTCILRKLMSFGETKYYTAKITSSKSGNLKLYGTVSGISNTLILSLSVLAATPYILDVYVASIVTSLYFRQDSLTEGDSLQLDWIYIGDGSYLPVYATAAAPISFLFESKDFDFAEPDKNKSLIRLGVRVTDLTPLRTTPLEIAAEGSTDRGATWKSLGTLYFRVGDDEAKLNFRLTGPTLRYRLTSSSLVPPYRIEEHTLRVRGRGLEGQRGDRA